MRRRSEGQTGEIYVNNFDFATDATFAVLLLIYVRRICIIWCILVACKCKLRQCANSMRGAIPDVRLVDGARFNHYLISAHISAS